MTEVAKKPSPESGPLPREKLAGKKITTASLFADFVQNQTPKDEEGKPVSLTTAKEKMPSQLSLTETGHEVAEKLYDHIVETNPKAEYSEVLRQLRTIREEIEAMRRNLTARAKSPEEIQALTARFSQEHLILDDVEARHLGSQLTKEDSRSLKEETKSTWGLYKKLINLSAEEARKGINTPENAVIENLTKAEHYAEITENKQLATLLEKETALHRHYVERMIETMALEGEYSSSPWLAIRNHFAKEANFPERFFTYQIAGSIVAAKNTVYQHLVEKLGERARSFSPSQIKQAMEIALLDTLPQDAEELLAENPPERSETAREYIYRSCGIELKKGKRIVTNESLTEKAIEHLDSLEERLKVASAEDVEKAVEISDREVARRLLRDIRGLFTKENLRRLFSRDTLRRLTTKESAVRMLRAQRVMMSLVVPVILSPTGQEFIHNVDDFLDDHLPHMPFGAFLENFPGQAEAVLNMMHDAKEILSDPMEHFLESTAEHLPDLVAHVGPTLEDIGDRSQTVLAEIHQELTSRVGEASAFTHAAAEEAREFAETIAHPEAQAAEPETPAAAEHHAPPQEYYPGPSPAPAMPTGGHVGPEEHHPSPPPATSPEAEVTQHPATEPHLKVSEVTTPEVETAPSVERPTQEQQIAAIEAKIEAMGPEGHKWRFLTKTEVNQAISELAARAPHLATALENDDLVPINTADGIVIRPQYFVKDENGNWVQAVTCTASAFITADGVRLGGELPDGYEHISGRAILHDGTVMENIENITGDLLVEVGKGKIYWGDSVIHSAYDEETFSDELQQTYEEVLQHAYEVHRNPSAFTYAEQEKTIHEIVQVFTELSTPTDKDPYGKGVLVGFNGITPAAAHAGAYLGRFVNKETGQEWLRFSTGVKIDPENPYWGAYKEMEAVPEGDFAILIPTSVVRDGEEVPNTAFLKYLQPEGIWIDEKQ